MFFFGDIEMDFFVSLSFSHWRVLLSERAVVSLLSAFFNLGQGTLNWDFPEVYPHFLSLLFYPSIS